MVWALSNICTFLWKLVFTCSMFLFLNLANSNIIIMWQLINYFWAIPNLLLYYQLVWECMTKLEMPCFRTHFFFSQFGLKKKNSYSLQKLKLLGEWMVFISNRYIHISFLMWIYKSMYFLWLVGGCIDGANLFFSFF